VSARRLDACGPFLAHEMSIARPGDIRIENGRVCFYIAGRRDRDGYSPFAGWMEDAALAPVSVPTTMTVSTTASMG